MSQAVMKKTKFFISLMKEKVWLEEMALKGWLLTDMRFGFVYTFQKMEPKHMIYEVDRFNLPKNPTLAEIRSREEFMEVAQEMGWTLIFHDEDLNYYLCKEYVEGEINELYNDEEARIIHAEKFKRRYREAERQAINLVIAFAACWIISDIYITNAELSSGIYDIYCYLKCIFAGLVLIYGICAKVCYSVGALYEKEMRMGKSEWLEWKRINKGEYKKTYKLIVTNKKLKHFLAEESRRGWHILQINAVSYVFKKGECCSYSYDMDTRYLTNIRNKKAGRRKYVLWRDWNGLNNDWQVQSLKDAESRGWEFVCALESRAVLYRDSGQKQKPLNDIKYERYFRLTSIMGIYGVVVLISAVVGAVLGVLSAMYIK